MIVICLRRYSSRTSCRDWVSGSRNLAYRNSNMLFDDLNDSQSKLVVMQSIGILEWENPKWKCCNLIQQITTSSRTRMKGKKTFTVCAARV